MKETWLDSETHLEWATCKSEKPLPFTEIENYIKQLNSEGYAGHDDWRGPEIKELISLIDFSRASPAMREEISFRDDDAYWSATLSAKNDKLAWFIDFHFGYIHFNTRDNDFFVRAVRDADTT
ncbi:MAG: DUF1566 domain-containing protein [Proteobacteria bacterium]|nr:DUF1566 domain-containing protein [Pseudomonadota bacterium]